MSASVFVLSDVPVAPTPSVDRAMWQWAFETDERRLSMIGDTCSDPWHARTSNQHPCATCGAKPWPARSDVTDKEREILARIRQRLVRVDGSASLLKTIDEIVRDGWPVENREELLAKCYARIIKIAGALAAGSVQSRDVECDLFVSMDNEVRRARALLFDGAAKSALRDSVPNEGLGDLGFYVAQRLSEHHGEKCALAILIPGSMGARSFIVRGLGNPESFHSCSHGAGRAMSRGAAKKQITLEQHAVDTAGVVCRKDEGVLDESPRAYKNVDDVMRAQADLVEIVHELRGVVCVKG